MVITVKKITADKKPPSKDIFALNAKIIDRNSESAVMRLTANVGCLKKTRGIERNLQPMI